MGEFIRFSGNLYEPDNGQDAVLGQLAEQVGSIVVAVHDNRVETRVLKRSKYNPEGSDILIRTVRRIPQSENVAFDSLPESGFDGAFSPKPEVLPEAALAGIEIWRRLKDKLPRSRVIFQAGVEKVENPDQYGRSLVEQGITLPSLSL
ncbi:MAG: hypothetical protein A2152_01620 [Candidatus Levybacteria bacterium RBG_16_35_6]|nr:MAG: hypothetical protein A2152_01620 [Candidatus Levybacteria bacterium RBG_16_35_6]